MATVSEDRQRMLNRGAGASSTSPHISAAKPTVRAGTVGAVKRISMRVPTGAGKKTIKPTPMQNAASRFGGLGGNSGGSIPLSKAGYDAQKADIAVNNRKAEIRASNAAKRMEQAAWEAQQANKPTYPQSNKTPAGSFKGTGGDTAAQADYNTAQKNKAAGAKEYTRKANQAAWEAQQANKPTYPQSNKTPAGSFKGTGGDTAAQADYNTAQKNKAAGAKEYTRKANQAAWEGNQEKVAAQRLAEQKRASIIIENLNQDRITNLGSQQKANFAERRLKADELTLKTGNNNRANRINFRKHGLAHNIGGSTFSNIGKGLLRATPSGVAMGVAEFTAAAMESAGKKQEADILSQNRTDVGESLLAGNKTDRNSSFNVNDLNYTKSFNPNAINLSQGDSTQLNSMGGDILSKIDRAQTQRLKNSIPSTFPETSNPQAIPQQPQAQPQAQAIPQQPQAQPQAQAIPQQPQAQPQAQAIPQQPQAQPQAQAIPQQPSNFVENKAQNIRQDLVNNSLVGGELTPRGYAEQTARDSVENNSINNQRGLQSVKGLENDGIFIDNNGREQKFKYEMPKFTESERADPNMADIIKNAEDKVRTQNQNLADVVSGRVKGSGNFSIISGTTNGRPMAEVAAERRASFMKGIKGRKADNRQAAIDRAVFGLENARSSGDVKRFSAILAGLNGIKPAAKDTSALDASKIAKNAALTDETRAKIQKLGRVDLETKRNLVSSLDKRIKDTGGNASDAYAEYFNYDAANSPTYESRIKALLLNDGISSGDLSELVNSWKENDNKVGKK